MPKTHILTQIYLTLFITVLFSPVHAQRPIQTRHLQEQIYDEPTEICSVIPDGSVQKETLTISIDTELSIEQEACLEIFEFEITDSDLSEKYLHLEISFDEYPFDQNFELVLLQRNETEPQILYNETGDSDIVASNMDYNGYINKKTYQNILLEPQEIIDGEKIYFAVYKFFEVPEDYEDYTISYKIKLIQLDDPACPNDCSGNGECNKEGKCECEDHFFDLDCSVEAQEIEFGDAESAEIQQGEWAYFYFQIKQFTKDIKLNFKKDSGTVTYAISFNPEGTYDLPNMVRATARDQMQAAIEEETLYVSDRTLENHDQEFFLMGFYNPQPISNQVKVKVEYSVESSVTRTTVMYIMIGVSSLLIVIWGIITVIKYKVHRENELNIQSQQQVQRVSRDFLSKEEMEKYFPKTKYKELNKTFQDATCSICLEDFEADTLCRQVYCGHIFHANCIEAWLSNHYNCPNCKKNMKREAIERFKNGLPEIPESEEGAVPNDNSNNNQNNNPPAEGGADNQNNEPAAGNDQPSNGRARQNSQGSEREIEFTRPRSRTGSRVGDRLPGELTDSQKLAGLRKTNPSDMNIASELVAEEEKTNKKINEHKPPRPHMIRKMTSLKEDEKSNADIFMETDKDQHNLPERMSTIKGLSNVEAKNGAHGNGNPGAESPKSDDMQYFKALEKLARGSRTDLGEYGEVGRKQTQQSQNNFEDF